MPISKRDISLVRKPKAKDGVQHHFPNTAGTLEGTTVNTLDTLSSDVGQQHSSPQVIVVRLDAC